MTKTQDTWLQQYEARISTRAAQFGSAWAVANLKQIEMHGGVAWSGDLLYRGVWVGMLENNGDGGPDTLFRCARPDVDGEVYDRAIAEWDAIVADRPYSIAEEETIAALMQHLCI